MSPNFTLLSKWLAAAAIIGTAACSDSLVVPQPPLPMVDDSVAPQTTDPAIDKALDTHRIFIDSASTSNHLLLVFMPGTAAKPTDYLLVQREAAHLGYHVIGLMFQNDVKLAKVCSATTDPSACFSSARMEILDGVDRTPVVTVSTANSIENRLAKVLTWLATNRPTAEAWSQFLDAGAPAWARIVVAGHSQGGGEAMMLAQVHVVARVVLFSATPDDIGGGAAPPWEASHATGTAHYFGLAHQGDPAFPAIKANWTTLGMNTLGSVVVVDTSTAPYGSTHSLSTSLLPQPGMLGHNATAMDASTPIDSATQAPKLRAAWRYLLGPGT
jgi:hypothetical protein